MKIYVVHLISQSCDNYYLTFSYKPSNNDIEKYFKEIFLESEWEYIDSININENNLINDL